MASDEEHFAPPEISDDDIRGAALALDLPEDAFHGGDGQDPRRRVLECMDTVDVAACPGSGKTTLLVAKLAILAEKWLWRTRGICVLSHTNAARQEIETRLAARSAAQNLLLYPHFVGTIQNFVDRFLAGPWLRSLGCPVRVVDDDQVRNVRAHLIETRRNYEALKNHVGRKGKNKDPVADWVISSPDFEVRRLTKKGKFPVFKSECRSKSQLGDLVRSVAKMGYHRYAEMFMWAQDALDKHPGLARCIRGRFPLLFIDEAQDNTELQSALLHRVFMDRTDHAPVIRQRFGDANQAIYSSPKSDEPQTDVFPDASLRKELPNSHRFGPTIAKLASPLELTPYKDGLNGQGPQPTLETGEEEAPHTIFLFDERTVEKVLPAYAKLLLETFSDSERTGGVFTAVGFVHSKRGDDKRPRHVAHYWPKYEPTVGGQDPRPGTLCEYIHVGQAMGRASGEVRLAVDKIAEGLLRLARMVNSNAPSGQSHHAHRRILRALEKDAEVRKEYADFVTGLALDREALTEETWDHQGHAKAQQIASAVAELADAPGKEAPAGETDTQDFLAWKGPAGEIVTGGAPGTGRGNIYTHRCGNRSVGIRVGSIHSVKGESHTATLVLETFWEDRKDRHNLQLLLPLLQAAESAADLCGVQAPFRCKVHYVAMTRPTHLLCLAMKADSVDGEARKALEERGWKIREV